MKYEPRKQFVPFHNRKQRWAALCTHRRAGKTVALINDIIFGALECQLHRPQLAYVAPTFRQAKRVAWPYLKDYAAPYMSEPPSESELKVILHGGRTIYCLGADNPDSIRGMYLDGGVGDEYAMFRPSVFSTIIRPALSDRNGWWVFTSTPRGKNQFYDEVVRARTNPDKYYLMVLPADTSGIIPELELQALRQDMSENEFAQEYLCSFDAAITGAYFGKEILKAESEGRVTSVPYDPALLVHTVWDLGISDSTAIWFWQQTGREVRLIDYYEASGYGLDHYVRVLQEKKYLYGDHWAPHDIKVRELGTGRSRHEVAESLGITFRHVPQMPVIDGINAARLLIKRCWFDKTKCEDGIEALRQYRERYDEKRRVSGGPLHDWTSHAADSWRYLAVAMQEIQPVSNKPKLELTFEGAWMR